jgi:hypothetical protein
MNLKTMDKLSRDTYVASQNWNLLDWKDFRASIDNYYELKDRAYSSGIPSDIKKFRELKLKLMLQYNKKTK